MIGEHMNNLERCLAYMQKLPPAIDGSYGHAATMLAARTCQRFGLSAGEAWQALTWFNENRCSPPWNEKDLRHKLASAEASPVQKPLGQSFGRKPAVKPVSAAELADLSAHQRAYKVLMAKVAPEPVIVAPVVPPVPAQRLREARAECLAELASKRAALQPWEELAVVEAGEWYQGEPPEPPPPIDDSECRAAAYCGWPPLENYLSK